MRAFVLAFVIALPLTAAAQEQVPPEMILQQILHLDATQVSAIQQAAAGRQTAVGALIPQIQKAQQSLATALTDSAPPDPAEVGKLVIGIRDLQRQIEGEQQRFQDSFTALLTDAQKTQVEQIRAVEGAMRAAQALHQLGL